MLCQHPTWQRWNRMLETKRWNRMLEMVMGQVLPHILPANTHSSSQDLIRYKSVTWGWSGCIGCIVCSTHMRVLCVRCKSLCVIWRYGSLRVKHLKSAKKGNCILGNGWCRHWKKQCRNSCAQWCSLPSGHVHSMVFQKIESPNIALTSFGLSHMEPDVYLRIVYSTVLATHWNSDWVYPWPHVISALESW